MDRATNDHDPTGEKGAAAGGALAEAEEKLERRIERMERLADRLDNSNLAEYVKLSENTWKILWLNLLSGIARGLGFTLGTTIILAIVYKVIRKVISMNIPYITEMLMDFVEVIRNGP